MNFVSCMRKSVLLICICLLSLSNNVFSQSLKGSISGTVIDKNDKNGLLFGAIIRIKGSQLAAQADIDGKYSIKNVPSGEYNIEVTYLGYSPVLYTGIKLKAGENRVLNFFMETTVLTKGEIVIIGDKPLVDVEKSDNTKNIDKDRIQAAPARQVQEILNTVAGVTNSPTGLHIRGSRTYETGFYIDDVSAKDPLSGTGFGLDLGSNAINDIDVTTSGSGVDFGNNTAGVINVKTSSGGDKWHGNAMYKTDKLGNPSSKANWNQSVFECSVGGPIIKNKLTFFTSVRTNFSDTYLKNPPKKLNSSILGTDFFTPRGDDRYNQLVKFNYNVTQKLNISLSYTKSITVNQDQNMLRIFGNNASYVPGYQWTFSQQPDNANTYTQNMNLTALTINHLVSKRFGYKFILSRLYVHLRADANGRNWRPTNQDQEFDPKSNTQYPVSYYNPQDSVVFVNAPSGLYNNNGIATLWHDHIVEEYTGQWKGYYQNKSENYKLNFGTEFKHQWLQWIDVTRPWVGAPIKLADGSTSQTFRLGEQSDIWKVTPNSGAVYASNTFKYLGLIAEIGGRFEYWARGSYLDQAVDNPAAPIRDEIRQQYKDQTVGFAGQRWKARLLPRISASFPIKENQVLYFNYKQSMVQPHPSYLYAGLDPFYQDRSTIANVGNPNLNPEIDISYELGLKSQITNNDAFGIAAYWKDKYDFITSAAVDIKDATGRDVQRTLNINSDYARIRGVELSYQKRIKKWFSGQASLSYSASTGQSSSASETIRDILATGNREDTREYYLPWDVPIDAKFNAIFTLNRDSGFFHKKWINKMRFYIEGTYRSGRRYTPYVFKGYEQTSGRPIYELDNTPSAKNSKTGQDWFNVDITYNKWWNLSKASKITWIIEITNVFDFLNPQIVNPITGRAYKYGDPVGTNLKDPLFNDPRDPRSRQEPPNNPARYLPGRHYLTGFSITF